MCDGVLFPPTGAMPFGRVQNPQPPIGEDGTI